MSFVKPLTNIGNYPVFVSKWPPVHLDGPLYQLLDFNCNLILVYAVVAALGLSFFGDLGLFCMLMTPASLDIVAVIP